MAEKYLPLKIMDENDQYMIPFEDHLKAIMANGFPKMTEQEYVETMVSIYSGEQYDERIIKSLSATYSKMLYQLGLLDERYDALTELCDVILRPYIYRIWRRNKQVYKPDSDFCQALIKTENIVLTKDMVNHLPCNHFFIDVIDCEMFNPIKGIFVNVFNKENRTTIIAYLVDGQDSFWSSMYTFVFDETGEAKINYNDFNKRFNSLPDEDTAGGYNFQPAEDFREIPEHNLSRMEVTFFIMQLITYIKSNEPQFEESSTTKATYRPPKQSSVIKNKFSEVRMYDIGVRFGKTFREQKRRYKCNTILPKHFENKRKSPVPHFRCAHWQSYWVGKGRVERIVKWIEPTFVGGGESGDVVIHEF